MKHIVSIFTLLVICINFVLGAPRVKIVTSYVTPNMLSANNVYAQDSTVSSGLNTVAKGTYVYVRAWNYGDTGSISSANWTFISKPTGSNATLTPITGLSWWAKFKADSSGAYQIQVSVVASTGSKDTTTTIYAATYVGVGGFDNVPATFPNCMSCHNGNETFMDIFNRWKVTKHATTFKTNITSGPTSYGINQFKVHTMGYDHNIYALNNGFDDKARQLGWNWTNYSPPKAANWDSLKNRFSSLVAFANVGCESCHGPGSEHVYNGGDTNRIQKSVDEGVCGKCHDSPLLGSQFAQWKNAMHSGVVWSSSFAQGTTNSSYMTNNLGNCIRCHDGQGYVNFTKGVGTNTNGMTVAKQEMVGCASCHDPHGNSNSAGLRNRPLNSDTLGNGYHYTGVGKGIVCMDCHKSRRDNVSYTQTRVTSSTWGPHHNAQADIYLAQNAATFGGPPYRTTQHKDFLSNACVTCHMAPTDTSGANKDKVGGHALFLHNPATDFDHVKGCQGCHAGKTRFDQFIADQDYDGDSQIEPWRLEIDGCMTKLRIELPPRGIDSIAWQLIAADSFNVPLRKAFWNYQLIDGGSERGMHNPKYTVDVLIASRNALLGIFPISNEVPLRFELSQNYPNPFNPTTKFNVSIPKTSKVVIKVYDILGREVATLANSVLNAGKYVVDWDGYNDSRNSVSSGVYFYRVVAGEFVDVKKMLMIK